MILRSTKDYKALPGFIGAPVLVVQVETNLMPGLLLGRETMELLLWPAYVDSETTVAVNLYKALSAKTEIMA